MKPDLSLLRPWTAEAARAEPFAEPSVAVFRRGETALVFVATRHVYGPDAAVFPTLARAFREFAPRGLVVEGIPGGEAAAAAYRDYALVREADGCARCTEREYAVVLACRAGIAFRGGEPPEREVLDVLLARGFEPEDFLGFNVVRFVPQWRREGGLDRERFDALADAELVGLAKTVGLEPRFRVAEFHRWFAAHRPPGPPLLEFDDEDAGPFDGPEATRFQRISWTLDGTRERAAAGAIGAALQEHGRVLTVYGGGHLVKQRKVWEALLGPAENLKWR